jgi:hypothetical protein
MNAETSCPAQCTSPKLILRFRADAARSEAEEGEAPGKTAVDRNPMPRPGTSPVLSYPFTMECRLPQFAGRNRAEEGAARTLSGTDRR